MIKDVGPGARVREYRSKLGLTQEQFAEMTGLTVNYIARVERGESFPRLDNLVTIINTLGVTADAIFCDVIDKSTNYPISSLAQELDSLSPNDKLQIMEILRVLIRQAKDREQDRIT